MRERRLRPIWPGRPQASSVGLSSLRVTIEFPQRPSVGLTAEIIAATVVVAHLGCLLQWSGLARRVDEGDVLRRMPRVAPCYRRSLCPVLAMHKVVHSLLQSLEHLHDGRCVL